MHWKLSDATMIDQPFDGFASLDVHFTSQNFPQILKYHCIDFPNRRVYIFHIINTYKVHTHTVSLCVSGVGHNINFAAAVFEYL
jgi:hypothetical protein